MIRETAIKIFLPFLFLSMYPYLLTAQEKSKSELVFFTNKSIDSVINNIINTKRTCQKSMNHVWYMEQKGSKSFLVTIGRVGNLLQSLKGRELYITTVSNELVFILSDKNSSLIEATGFYMNLEKYINDDFIFFEDFSSWLVKKNGNFYYIANKHIFKCKVG